MKVRRPLGTGMVSLALIRLIPTGQTVVSQQSNLPVTTEPLSNHCFLDRYLPIDRLGILQPDFFTDLREQIQVI
jgi:hypothetical protein